MKRLGSGLVIFALLMVNIATAWAGGVSGVPATIEITEALRGSTIFREVTFRNNTGVEIPFDITTTGEIAAWIAIVDPSDRSTEILEVLDTDGTGTRVLVRIDVPDDAANRTYDGSLIAILAPPETETGSGVGLGVRINITINVTGEQLVAATLADLSIRDTEVGVAATVRAAIRNSGNINVVPEFDIEILRDGLTVSRTTTASQPSFPGEQAIFEIFWDTSNAEPGEYTARVSVDFAGIDLGTRDLDFTLYPAGILNRQVVLVALELDQEPWAGAYASLTATIENPGQVDVTSTIVGELTQNGVVVSTYESQPFLVKPGEMLPIPVNIQISEVGDYEFTARVRYGDEESDPRSVAFSAVTAPTGVDAVDDDTGGGPPIGTIAFVALLLAALIGGGMWMVARTRNGEDSTEQPDEDVDPDKQVATVGSED